MGSGGRAVERRTVNRGDGGSIPPTAVSKLRQFRSSHIYLCRSEETLKAGGPFYLVSRLHDATRSHIWNAHTRMTLQNSAGSIMFYFLQHVL